MIIPGRLCKENPTAASEDLYVLFIVHRKSWNNDVAGGFLAAYPAHKAVDFHHLFQCNTCCEHWRYCQPKKVCESALRLMFTG